MPDEYSAEDIDKIISHSYISKSGEVCSHETHFLNLPDDYDDTAIYRERPFFECYLEAL